MEFWFHFLCLHGEPSDKQSLHKCQMKGSKFHVKQQVLLDSAVKQKAVPCLTPPPGKFFERQVIWQIAKSQEGFFSKRFFPDTAACPERHAPALCSKDF